MYIVYKFKYINININIYKLQSFNNLNLYQLQLKEKRGQTIHLRMHILNHIRYCIHIFLLKYLY